MSGQDQVKALTDAAESKLLSDIGALIDDANAAADALKAEVATLTAQAADLQTKITSALDLAASLTAQASDLTSKLKSANDQVTTLTGEVASRDSDIAAQTSQIQTLTSQVTDRDGKINDLTTQIAGLNGDVKTRDAKIVDLQAQVAADAATSSGLNSQLAALNSQVSDLSGQITALKAQIADLTAQLATAKATSIGPITSGKVETYTAPDVVQNMTQVSPGVFQSTDFPGNHAVCLQFNRAQAVPWGSVIRKTFTRATAYQPSGSQNDKPDRDWLGSIGGNTHDEFCGTQTDGSMVFQTEDAAPISVHYDGLSTPDKPRGDSTGPWNRAYFTWPGNDPNGKLEVWETKYPSSPTALDGYVRITIGAKVVLYADKWQPGPTTRNIFLIQEVVSGSPSIPAGTFVKFINPKVEVVLP